MRDLKPIPFLFILSISSLLSFACGNEYTRSEMPFYNKKLQLNVLLHRADEMAPYWYHGQNMDGFKRYSELGKAIRKADWDFRHEMDMTPAVIQRLFDKEVDYKILSDYGWNTLKFGKCDNAVKLLEALYEKYPNEYNIVANLGTAYEVASDNVKALALLKKAVEINPQSHYGSEWIHLKILEQKVSSTPDYKKILDLNVPNNFNEWLGSGTNFYHKEISPDSLMVQIAYQLHERISFIRPTDPIIGKLVFDFAELVALVHPPYKAIEFYDYAARYDPSLSFATKERIRMIRASRNKKRVS
jgi:tetratricopeptide (TPR) repeat protein